MYISCSLLLHCWSCSLLVHAERIFPEDILKLEYSSELEVDRTTTKEDLFLNSTNKTRGIAVWAKIENVTVDETFPGSVLAKVTRMIGAARAKRWAHEFERFRQANADDTSHYDFEKMNTILYIHADPWHYFGAHIHTICEFVYVVIGTLGETVFLPTPMGPRQISYEDDDPFIRNPIGSGHLSYTGKDAVQLLALFSGLEGHAQVEQNFVKHIPAEWGKYASESEFVSANMGREPQSWGDWLMGL